MGFLFRIAVLLGFWAIGIVGAAAPVRAAEAQLVSTLSQVADREGGIAIDLGLSAAVPYRAFVMAAPPRLVLDFAGVDLTGVDPGRLDRSDHVLTLQTGPIRSGWSRIVAVLDGPFRIASAQERVGEKGAVIHIGLVPATAEEFAAAVDKGAPQAARWFLPAAVDAAPPKRRQTGDAPLIVVLDPGHGGIDPGADADGQSEAAIILGFARELRDVLRARGMEVVLTRDGDDFVPLEARISAARVARADVFLSLHADALREGDASGSTIYLLSDTASEVAAALLAERHDRSDLLAGVDLSRQDDVVATVLMDMSRAETQPRADRLARELEAAIVASGGQMHRHAIQHAGFSVLKAPDIPSLLIELGFLSSKRDRARLADPGWRRLMARAIADALRAWAVADAAEARLIRR